jgi:uncharacterized membrane protein
LNKLERTYRQRNIHKLTLCAVMAALLFVLTFLIRIPILASGGYIHMGDTIIYLCGYILGGSLGAAIAGIGSALADLAAGAVIYILPTFVIKALMGFMVGLIAFKRTKVSLARFAVACLAAGAWMVAGYFIYEAAMFDLAYGMSALPFNVVQYLVNVVCAVLLKGVADRIKLFIYNQSAK